jgi:hypothetical protein
VEAVRIGEAVEEFTGLRSPQRAEANGSPYLFFLAADFLAGFRAAVFLTGFLAAGFFFPALLFAICSNLLEKF